MHLVDVTRCSALEADNARHSKDDCDNVYNLTPKVCVLWAQRVDTVNPRTLRGYFNDGGNSL